MEEYIRNPLDDSWETVGSDDEAYQYWQKYWNKEAELGPLSREDFLEYIPEDVFDDQALQLKRFPTLFKSIEEAITREEYEKLYTTVITGHPGIGKTFFGLYVLYRRCVQRKPTLYWDEEYVYLFHDSGV
ncbi:hypothetical protein WG66_005542 [Moniliophthora roreri]|nr:hypothetical protein WG66_005542 [Moniliophthora roreri]